jgi:hypothetical protein
MITEDRHVNGFEHSKFAQQAPHLSAEPRLVESNWPMEFSISSLLNK